MYIYIYAKRVEDIRKAQELHDEKYHLTRLGVKKARCALLWDQRETAALLQTKIKLKARPQSVLRLKQRTPS